jgi:hypothetical protein
VYCVTSTSISGTCEASRCANSAAQATTTCQAPTPNPTPTPTPTPNPTPTPTVCGVYSSCGDCVAKGCGMCYSSSTSAPKCSSQSDCSNTGTFKTVCESTNAPTPTPTPTPSECGALTSCSACTAKASCGWCEAKEFRKCMPLGSNTATTSSASLCSSKSGIWYERACTAVVTPAPTPGPTPKPNEPTPSPTPKPTEPVYNKVTITATVDKTTTVDVTTADKVAVVIQKTVADALKIDQSKVTVVVSTSLKDDGSTAFSIEIKVSSDSISSDKFAAGVSTISSDSIESSISSQGVNVQSGSVNISNNNQQSYAEKIILVSLLLLAVVLF